MLKGILCVFILVVLFYSYIYGIESLSGLESEDVQVREKSAQSIRNDREKLINYLMILVEKHKAVKNFSLQQGIV